MPRAPEPLSDHELAELDAAYTPFPAFGDWPADIPRLDLWTRRSEELSQLKSAISEAELDEAIQVTIRAAAFDTGAIEGLYQTDRGLTRTIATQAFMWEQRLEESGAQAFFDAQLQTYELVLDVATKNMPVTEAWIRRLHEELTGPQETYTVMTPAGPQEQPLPRGEYKRYPNHVETANGATHSYAPVADTPPEMERFVEELTSAEFAAAPAAVQAAYAHYALAAIHPFADGNGRVARALASVYLYRDASIPLLILADQRDRYLDALSAADHGDHDRFVQFVFDAGLAAVGMVIDTVKAAQKPPAEETLDRFRALMTAQGELTHREIDAIGVRIAGEFSSMLRDGVRNLSLPQGISATVYETAAGRGIEMPSGFRPPIHGGPQYVQLSLHSQAPARANRSLHVGVFVSTNTDETETVRVEAAGGYGGVTLGLNEVHPTTTMTAHHRLSALADLVVRAELDALLREAHAALKASGYDT